MFEAPMLPGALATSPAALSGAIAVFLLAGLVKGVVGLGLPTVSMALLAFVFSPAEAAALLIVPSLVTNAWQLRPLAGLGPALRRLGGMQAGICAGTWAGALALGAPSGAWTMVSLGVVLVAYALWSLAGAEPSVSRETEEWLGPLVGVVTGLVTAATGVFVVPAVPYLQALGLQRDALIQAMGLSFTVSTLALAAGLFFNASYSAPLAGASALLLLPALLGMYLGQNLRRLLSPSLFRACFLGSLIVLGAHMIMRELVLWQTPSPLAPGPRLVIDREK